MIEESSNVTITYNFNSDFEAEEWVKRKAEAHEESMCWFELKNYLRNLDKYADLSNEKQELIGEIINYMHQLES